MSDAITSVNMVIAVWMPVTVVFRSLATVAIDTFITDASRIITNCAAASVTSTACAAPLPAPAVDVEPVPWLSIATVSTPGRLYRR